MDLRNFAKKFLIFLIGSIGLNAQAMQPDFWSNVAAVHNGNQMPFINTAKPFKPAPTKPKINVQWDWQKKCTALHKTQFLDELELLFKVEKSGSLTNSANWISPVSYEFLNKPDLFMPYVMKLEVKPGAEIAFHGDIHGDKDSLIAYLKWLAENGYTDPADPFKIIKDNFYIIFLGDYTDRGKYGAEVIFTIARLKRTNSDRVFLVRGNHEDVDINANYGFKDELKEKFNDDGTIMRSVQQMYNYLPVALYLVCNNGTAVKDCILCDHGGIEVGFNVERCRTLLESTGTIKYTALGSLERETNCEKLPTALEYIKRFENNKNFDPKSPKDVHFLWNDFDVNNFYTSNNTSRGWMCHKPFTDYVNMIQSSPRCRIRGIFRGHQHGDNLMMLRIFNRDKKNHDADIGVGKLWIEDDFKPAPEQLWDGVVCTFSVCPHTPYGKEFDFNFDSFGILKIANKYTDWKLQMNRVIPA